MGSVFLTSINNNWFFPVPCISLLYHINAKTQRFFYGYGRMSLCRMSFSPTSVGGLVDI